MAGEKIEFKKGQTLKIKSVRSGTRQDGSEWMQINVVDESGKIEAGAFINPIAGLHEDDHVVIDDLSLISKRAPNRYAYNVKTKPFTKLDSPMMFITENTPNLTVHLAEGGTFGGSSFGEGGFGTGDFDPEEGQLPF
jgi:hypothetical protein